MAPSKELNDALGAIGGGLLASMMAPQLWKLYKTRKAQDISMIFLLLYFVGTLLLFIYLYYEGATVAWICLAVEMGLLAVVIVAKLYLDNWGPHSARGRAMGSQEGRPAGLGSISSDASKDSSRRASGEGDGQNQAEQGAGSSLAGNHMGGAAEGVRQRGHA